MISYALLCDNGHRFDSWFRSSDDCADQIEGGFVTCPKCGSDHVSKALMAPAVRSSKKAAQHLPAAETAERVPALAGDQKKLAAAVKALREAVTAESEYVGDRFAEEARRIHEEDEKGRGIYGEATPVEVKELHEDGIAVLPLPTLPEEHN